jgi:hypothetical protein
MILRTRYGQSATVLLALGILFSLVGCSNMTTTAPVQHAIAFQGAARGGQQPITGASLFLYAASTSGYGATNANLLTTEVKTDANGAFTITGDYSCGAGQQMYIVAMGGNPGGGTNANAGVMAALGDCSGLKPTTFINMNEITTVGSVFALAPFMSSYKALGTSNTNVGGMVRAFASVNKIVNIATGSSVGPALPVGATAPSAEINTLADILAACINSQGGLAGDETPCGHLFSWTTPSGGSAPTDVIQATLNIARNPALNAANLFTLPTPSAPFAPKLPAAPRDWTLSINYTGGGFNTPKSTTVDANGNVWVGNAGNNTVTILAQSGNPLSAFPLSGNGLNVPSAVAIDANGNCWVANAGGTTVSVFTPQGGTILGSPFDGLGTISAPMAIAIDGLGNVWVSNSGNNSVTKLSGAGMYLQQATVGINQPGALAINFK